MKRKIKRSALEHCQLEINSSST